MSVRVMSLVWDSFNRGGSEKLVMLAMADWCNDEGGSLHPSHDAVAKKCNISRSQAVRIIRNLCDEGYLTVIANQFGGSAGTTKQYRLNISMLTGSTHATGSVDATGSTHATRRVAPMHKTGSTHATQTTIEPSIEPPYTPLPPKNEIVVANKIQKPTDDGFDEFWHFYPKKVGKMAAMSAWKKAKVNVDEVIHALQWQVNSKAWTKSMGEFIPNPASYLNQGRWMDEPQNEGVPF